VVLRFLHCLSCSCSCSFGVEIVILGRYSSDFGLVGILFQIKKPCFWKLMNNQTRLLFLFYFCVPFRFFLWFFVSIFGLFTLVGDGGVSSSMSFEIIYNINSFALIIGVILWAWFWAGSGPNNNRIHGLLLLYLINLKFWIGLDLLLNWIIYSFD
jgi:hypothetical protein